MSDKTDKIKQKKKKKKIIKYRKPLSVNIGFIVFFAIFAYILIYMAMYFTRDRVSIYEVVYGKMRTRQIRHTRLYYCERKIR